MKRKDQLGELRKLSNDELKARSRGLGEELMKLRFRQASGQLQQGHRLKQAKRELARVETIRKQKASTQQKGA